MTRKGLEQLMCKVSIVVPIYNVKKYINECVNSLLKQTLRDIDIILVDDGSIDGSGQICDDYARRFNQIRVIQKKNGGLGSARNVGLEAARGKYVYFIDGDDSLKKNALETLYNLAERNNLEMILFSAECFSEELGIIYNANEYQRTKYLNEVTSGKELFQKLTSVNEYYASITLRFYNTSYLQKKEYRFPEDIIHEDEIYAYWSLIQASKVECIADRFYNRRFRAGSIMTSKKEFESSIGYIYTWKEIVTSIGDLTAWRENEIQNAIDFANSRLKIAINKYTYSFDRFERKKFRVYTNEIKEIAQKCNTVFDNERLISFFLKNPSIYRLVARIYGLIRRIKNTLLNSRESLVLLISLLELKIGHLLNRKFAILIGTPTHGNLGDQAIVYAEKHMLSKMNFIDNIVEISSKSYLKYTDTVQQYISKNDIIIIDGGGSMGTLWVNNEYRFRDIVKRFISNNVYIFPQTIYYGTEEWELKVLNDSIDVYTKHDKLTIFCRDKTSYDFAKQHFVYNRVRYAPDIVLSLYPTKEDINRQSSRALICFRNDIEANVDKNLKEEIINTVREKFYVVEEISTLTGGYVDRFTRKKELERKWKAFSKANLVVTDRLHAMLFCALTGTPCIAIDNLSKKVSGTYEWIKPLSYIKMVISSIDFREINIEQLTSNADRYEVLNEVKDKFREMEAVIENDKRHK